MSAAPGFGSWPRAFMPIALCLLAVLLGACGQHLQYQVRRGDTLYSIGWRYGYDYRQIAEWNQLEPPYTIHAGEWLRVAPPGPGGKFAAAPPPRAEETSEPGVKLFALGAAGAVEVQAPQRARIAWRWPARGEIISSFSADGNGSRGLDIAGKFGAPVLASADGRVVYSGNGLFGYGNLVILKHNDTFLSAYGHNSRLLVAEGDIVKAGDKIAEMGDSGASRIMLHYEIRRDGKPVDPLAYLPKTP